MTQEEVIMMLHEVQHPAKQDRNIVELGMLEQIELGENRVSVTLAFSRHRDPLGEYLVQSTKACLVRNCPQGTEIEVKTIIKDEKPAPKRGQNPNELGEEELEKVGRIIAVASGKGGVGKSTTAVNIAIALARLGYRVGLADADIYGPSIPTMTALVDEVPEAMQDGEKTVILPIEKYGVKWMSIGFMAKPEQALLWRGSMACNALKQMILQVRWGELDFLLIDMPPGTGDIAISLMNDIRVDAGIIVTTPQTVAVADVERGINMFTHEKVNKPILGIVENMSWFTPEELPENRYYIFGKGGAQAMADKYGLEVLGQIPLVQGIREAGDTGEPVALGSRPDSVAFIEIAKRIAETK